MVSANIQTPDQLMSVALLTVRESIQQYSQLATSMRQGQNDVVADLYEVMKKEEQAHERLLIEWMTQENINENPGAEPIQWNDPHLLTIYNEEARDPHYSTPYKVYAFAVHNEEQAFRFYSHIASHTKNEEVQKYAEILAHEELRHADTLRARRRQAYHVEREGNITETRLDPKIIRNRADLLTAAIYIDRYLAEEMTSILATTPAIEPLLKETQKQISMNEDILKNENMPGKQLVQNLDKFTQLQKLKDHNNKALQQLWLSCDRNFVFYDTVVATTEDEDVLHAAQQLTSITLARISKLKGIIDEQDSN